MCLALALGCQGTIGDAGVDPTNPRPPVDVPVEADSEAIDTPRIWRLSNVQYGRALDALIGEDVNPTMLQEVSGHGFPNTSDQNRVDSSRAIEYQNIAQTRTAAAIADPARWALLWSCSDAGDAGFEDASCVANFVSDFGRRAFRRELLAEERAEYVAFFEETRAAIDGQAAVQLVIETMIQSPSFLYRTEIGALTGPVAAVGELVELSAAEQASLLSFSLWGTAPDDALLDQFEGGGSAELPAQALEMMDDPRFVEGFTDFVHGLLELATLDIASPAVGYETGWDALTASMQREPRAFVEHLFFSEEVPADFAQLWTADYNFADQRLAPLYGAVVDGPGFEQVMTSGRPGLMGQLGVLAGHSLPNGTSPPRRGKLVATRVLCQPIPPPPANFEVDPMAREAVATTREFFEVMTGEGTCGAACHGFLNPPGFAFENFDAVGVWRDAENGEAINAAVDLGTLGLGSVGNARDLGHAIAESDRARECFVREYLRYALGHVEKPQNAPIVEAEQVRFVGSDGELRAMLAALLTHPAMRTRRMIE